MSGAWVSTGKSQQSNVQVINFYNFMTVSKANSKAMLLQVTSHLFHSIIYPNYFSVLHYIRIQPSRKLLTPLSDNICCYHHLGNWTIKRRDKGTGLLLYIYKEVNYQIWFGKPKFKVIINQNNIYFWGVII